MVRRDEVDLGVVDVACRASKLIVPLDTHVIRLGRCLRLTRYTSPGWRMAAEITASLRAHRSGRSRALRFFDLPRRHDERLRLRPPAGRCAMSAQGNVPAARPRAARGGAAIAALIAAFVVGVRRRSRGDGSSARRRTVLAATSPARDAVAYVFEGAAPPGSVSRCGSDRTCSARRWRETLSGAAEQRRRDRVDAGRLHASASSSTATSFGSSTRTPAPTSARST